MQPLNPASPNGEKSTFKLPVFREGECETRYQLREVDFYRGLGAAFVNRQGQHVLHKEEIRQGLKFIGAKENGHSSSAPADRQWRKDGDRRRTMAADHGRPDRSPFAAGAVAPPLRVFPPDRWGGGGSKWPGRVAAKRHQ